jgi:hypothetical protein
LRGALAANFFAAAAGEHAADMAKADPREGDARDDVVERRAKTLSRRQRLGVTA